MNPRIEKNLNRFIILGFLLYFLILLVERFLALFFSINQGGVYALTSNSFIGVATYSVTAISVLFGVITAISCFPDLVMGLLGKNEYQVTKEPKKAVIPSIALLFAGMMHTGYTLAPIQFVAYGFLIISMILVTVMYCLQDKANRFQAITSLIYLTLFSMAIPVCYSIADAGAMGIVYYIAEFACVFLLVPMFGLSLLHLFGEGKDSFSYPMVLIMALLDGLIIGLKWMEEINWFVLIFASLSIITYLLFFNAMRKKKPSSEE